MIERAKGMSGKAYLKARRIPILNAWINDVTMDEVLEDLTSGTMLTLHVDMMMKLQKDRDFYETLDKYDVITCDSQIIYFASKWLGTPLRERVSGSDYFPKFYMRHKDNPAITVFMVGGKPGIADLAARNINAKVGREIIVGAYAPPFDFEVQDGENDRIIAAVNASGASVCLVGLGGGRQEKWILQNRDRMPGVKLWLPLGGTIDYESGTFDRPAAWITDWGFEWLYRLVKQPRQRWRRYLVEQPPFLWEVLKQRLGIYKDPLGGER